jgi:hypothetical protein
MFYDVTIHISGSLYSISNLYFNVLQKVYNCLTEHCENYNILLSIIAIKIKMKYDKYWPGRF